MRRFLLILLLLPALAISQSNTSDKLFIEPWELCEEWLKEHIQELTQDFSSQDSLEALLQEWELFCEPNLASIRQRLLGELEFNGATEAQSDLSVFARSQLQFLRDPTWQGPLQEAHWVYSRVKAENLLERQPWKPVDKLLLEFLAAKSHHEALDLFYQREYKDVELSRKMRESMNEDINEVLNLSLGYNRLQFNQLLESELAAANGLWLAMDINDQKNLFSISISFNITEEKSYLRLLEDGQVRTSDLEMLFMGDINYGRTIWSGRRHALKLMVGIGMVNFGTDLSTQTEEGETISIGISSYHFNTGFDYSWRVYGSHEIGLRPLIAFTNFNRDEDLRGNLAGSILQMSLYYRF